jgi:BirA family biotin operon repressor/biotin-[acetyl-CoA-carboxylase] ligase
MTVAAPTLPDGFRLHALDTVGSTNDEAKRLARAGAADRTLIWAREQTAGRGRRGRAWHSPPGNLYLSLIVRPGGAAARAAQLGFVTALALGDALAELAGAALPLHFKWPNDLLVRGRKLAGILLESETSAGDAVDFVVIGMGVNLVSKPGDTEYPTTSLADHGTAGVSPAKLLAAVARHFDRWERRWQAEGFPPVRTAWVARAAGLGDDIRVRLERTTLSGRFRDLDHDGALILDTADGRRRIAAGEVFPLHRQAASFETRAAPAPQDEVLI